MAAIYVWLCISLIWMTKKTRTSLIRSTQSPCGSWVPYTDYKCVHIVDIDVIQTKEEAGDVCQSFTEIMVLDDIPQLITVTTEEEQKALQKYLFEEIGLLEPVWLGLDREDDGVFRWNNGVEMHFNNLAKQNVSDADRRCVQLESGLGSYPMGQWVKVNCRKRNLVVCEKLQMWTPARLKKNMMTIDDFWAEKQERTQQPITDNQKEIHSDAKTQVQTSSLLDSPCGDWSPFKNEKCIKLIRQSGLQTKQDADILCKTFSEELHTSDVPKLVTITTEEKQKFLQQLLFEDGKFLDSIWIGLELGNDSIFRWNDGMDLYFSNWIDAGVEGTTMESERNCARMESGEGMFKIGKWVRDNCKGRNAVVCERDQPLTLATLQNIIFGLKLEMERNQQKTEQKLNEANQKISEANQKISEEQQKLSEANQKISEANQKISEANQKISEASEQITSLQRNPVPVGFVYVQLPNRVPPTTIWPQTEWKDVSSEYAGLFFRVEGGGAAPFGELQEDNTRRLAQVNWGHVQAGTNPIIPSDGSWSGFTATGYNIRGSSRIGSRYRLTTGEIRPKNKAIKIWQRIK